MFNRRYFYLILVAVILTELLLFLVVSTLNFEIDKKIGVVTYTAIPLFVITLMQLSRNLRLQRAAFIKDYVSRFFTDQFLYRTFHELIYTYDFKTFNEVKKIYKEKNLAKVEETPFFEAFSDLQKERKEGSRLYHPRLFQGSPEERHLDALLGYFDVMAYYYAKGFLHIEDIVGSVGYYLAVIGEREVIKEYMKLNEEAWQDPNYQKMGITPPFGYLRRLLEDIQEYNEKFANRIKKLQRIHFH